ncbi:SDR family oxidoreductase [Dyella dinghuensis]|uniref:SDR family oxidoreductase n=1 Tax=Dyella dinghuensis TaxID=1920169 RepID=A0A3S0RF32_9GAMM|nr:SDR family oxidoreductase [Dyella dinghuensis]RUL65762.1 SDR family oxidoreductase [Dyella dinghuensis]
MSLKNKRIVVLGGSAGIGLATAMAAANEGALVVIASSSQARITEAKKKLPPSAEGHTVNLLDEGSIKSFFEKIGEYDHLVYTAGNALLVVDQKDLSLEEAQDFFGLRYWGAFLATKYGAGQIREGGSIVLTSGMAARRPRSGMTIVSSVCGAAEALTRALSVELAPIRVNAVCPGVIKTELWNSFPEAAREATFKRAEQNLLVKHVGEAHEVAEVYLYLMRAGFTTGQVVVSDGGASVS